LTWAVVVRVWATVVYEVYRVRPGDTVESIAQKYGITVEELKAANRALQSVDSHEAPGANQYLTIPIRPSPRAGSEPAVEEPESFRGGNQEAVPEAQSNPRYRTEKNARPPSPQGPSSQQKPEKAVGKLGIVNRDGAKIRRGRGAQQRVVFTCSNGTQLVVVKEEAGWYGVLMIDGSTCWIPQKDVDLTNVELVATESTPGKTGRFDVVREAFRYLGTPYKYGGETTDGIDCSAFVQKVFRQVGVSLPRTSREQFQVGQPVTWQQLLPGDRLYFAKGSAIDHTGIYIGGGRFIHASGNKGRVAIDSLRDLDYWKMFRGAKR